jgi:hypothetical protein
MRSKVMVWMCGLMSFVGTRAEAAEHDYASIVQVMTHGNAVIEREEPCEYGMKALFIGPRKGVSGPKLLLWGMPNGVVVAGNVYNHRGENLTEKMMAQVGHGQGQGLVRDVLIPNRRYVLNLKESELDVAGYSEGDGDVHVYVWVSKQCPFCQEAMKTWRDPGALKKARITWIPMDLQSMSIIRGDFDPHGGSSMLSEEDQKKLKKNQEIFVRFPRDAVPAFVVFGPGESENPQLIYGNRLLGEAIEAYKVHQHE